MKKKVIFRIQLHYATFSTLHPPPPTHIKKTNKQGKERFAHHLPSNPFCFLQKKQITHLFIY